jgi:hypothetical protein
MQSIDLFYRSFYEFKKQLETDKDSVPLIRFAQSLNKTIHEDITINYYECTIQEDWVLELERALPFLEKAIKEERQFIRNDEDVLPIEKIRRTSRQSVQDLSKHSDYITRKPDPLDNVAVVPDKLMIVRKENDYAVYENKVLFTTLMYAKEFVESRLQVIKDATNKYEGQAKLHKKIDVGFRSIDLKIDLNEIRKNDPLALAKNKSQTLLTRIENIFAMLLAFVKTPLINQLAKVEMVKRPITKTNVLKMNLNFKETLAIFDYLVDYVGTGYTLKRIEESLFPLPNQAVYDYTQVALLLSFITYQYSNKLTDTLSSEYFLEEERRQKKKEDDLLEHLKKIHLDISQSGKTLDQFLLLFEEGYRIIEKRVDLLKKQVKDLQLKHQKDIAQLNENHKQDISHLQHAHDKILEQKNHEFELERKQIIQLNQTQIQALKKAHSDDIKALELQHAESVEVLTQKHDNAIQVLQQEVTQKMEEVNQSKQAQQEANQAHQQQYEDLLKERDLIKVELLVLQKKHGHKVHPGDFTSKERFAELERIKQAFHVFFEQSWKETKKAIRQELIGKTNQKKVTSDLNEKDKNN